MAKPRVNTRCVADRYAMADEKIVEFSEGISGGLISLRRHPDGNLLVQLYNLDKDVEVEPIEKRRNS